MTLRSSLRFVDVTKSVGLEAFKQVSGDAEKMYLPASTGAGVALFDADSDGALDIFLINGSRIGGFEPGQQPTNSLFRNLGKGEAFGDITAGSGLESHSAWGQGVAVADVNGDSYLDLYVTNYGPNALYLNRRGGTAGRFEEVATEAGVDTALWSTGSTFIDFDRDGDLDLYVANFVRYDQVLAAPEERELHVTTWKGLRVVAGPRGLPAAADQLFRNDGISASGRMTFTEVTEEMGLAVGESSYGFQPTLGDVDGDGFLDLFVTNDSRPNFLWRNVEGRGFHDTALTTGVTTDRSGNNQACMGVTFEDHDGDGDLDLFVTNFADDFNTLYVSDGSGFFFDETAAAGLWETQTKNSLAWGTFFFDSDNDGDLDLFVANGHVYPQVEDAGGLESYAQTNQLLLQTTTGRFRDASAQAGSGFEVARVSRGAAWGDLDDDGDLDIVVNNLDSPPTVLRNDSPSPGNWLKVLLRGKNHNRSAIGARVRLEADNQRHSRYVRSSESFLSHHDLRLHFGLANLKKFDQLEVDWPDGQTETLPGGDVNVLLVIEQGKGIIATSPLN